MSSPHRNRLWRESSPYLLQHAQNPVNWYPWGPEALETARMENKPILLSVGYSSCHWCHVMEKESFEDNTIARLMNERFINIKVDREERPDIDLIYMNYVQMTTGHGGWPLTVFMNPELVPFFGGTYFPPRDVGARPGFKTVLEMVSEFFQKNSAEIGGQRTEIVQALRQSVLERGRANPFDGGFLREAAASMLSRLDRRNGGFASAPKFPSALGLGVLLRTYERFGDPAMLEAVELTLSRMGRGGIYDQLGGGFHRYSVDDRWFAPHFEKMLYDNALLARTYLEAFQLTANPSYRTVVEETLAYVERRMTHPSGGFFSAEDADSEGEEGRYYVWSWDDIEDLLDPAEAHLFCTFYGVERPGNWEGRNILWQPRDLEKVAAEAGLTSEEAAERLARSRARLLAEREKRVSPGLDDKILASWNGLMLTAFAEAAFVLGDDNYRRIALRNGEFLEREMMRGGRIHRTWKSGEARLNGYLDDYAHVAEGFLALFQLTGDSKWLQQARTLTQTQLELFLDPDQGDFFLTSSDHDDLLIRPKEHFDNATPSGNATTALNLLLLAEFTSESHLRDLAQRMLEKISSAVARHSLAFSQWAKALDFCLGPVQEIVIIGPGPERAAFEAVVRKSFLPRKVVVSVDDPTRISRLPLLEGKPAKDDRAIAYLCESYTCKAPATKPEELERQLESAGVKRTERT